MGDWSPMEEASLNLYAWRNLSVGSQFGSLTVAASSLEEARFIAWSRLHAALRDNKKLKMGKEPEDIIAEAPLIVEGQALLEIGPE